MIGNILGEAFNKYVKEQIDVRQKVYGKSSGRTPQELIYLNGKTSFARMISSVDLVEDKQFNTGKKRLQSLGVSEEYFGDGLARNFVLFAGTSTSTSTSTTNDAGVTTSQVNNSSENDLRKGINSNILSNAAYGLGGTEFGLQPMPHLGDITVDHRGEYGAYREATVSIKCYNPKQFEIINILYLSLGYSILLEWGNTCYFNNKEEFIPNNDISLQQFIFDKKNANSHLGLFKEIEKKKKESDGNYDALFGIVCNYTWTFKDGMYDISLKLITLGSIIESLNINYLSPGINIPIDENSNEEYPNRFSNDISLLLNHWMVNGNNPPKYNNTTPPTPLLNQPIPPFLSPNPSTNVETFSDEEVSNIITQGLQDAREDVESLSTPSTNFTITSNTQQVGTKVKILYEGTGFLSYIATTLLGFQPITPWESQGPFDFYKSVKSNDRCYYFIRLGALLEFIQKTQLIYNLSGELSTSSLINIDYNTDSNYMLTSTWMAASNPNVCVMNGGVIELHGKEYKPFPLLPDFKEIKNDIVLGKVMNIFVNCDYITETLQSSQDGDGVVSILTFLKNICNGISKSVGYQSELMPFFDEINNTLKIIEKGELPSNEKLLNKVTYSKFEVFGYNNYLKQNQSAGFVKSFNLNTQISNDLVTQIVIGAQSAGYPSKGVDPSNFSFMYRGLTDRIISRKSSAPIDSKSNTDEISDSLETNYLTHIGLYKKLLEYTSIKFNEFKDEDIPNYESGLRGFYEYQKIYTSNVGTPTQLKFMPLNFSLVLDGLSGMKIFQKFKADSRFLPYPYPDVITLNIFKLRHKISNNVWTTELETKFVPEFVKTGNFITTTQKDAKGGFYGTNSQGIGFGKGEATNNSGGFGGDLSPKGKTAPTKNPPPPTTPNADYLRGVMARLNSEGKNFKIIERYNSKLYISSDPEFKDLPKGNYGPVLTSNGDISEKLKNYAANVFENISNFWSDYSDENNNNPGGMKVEITAGNDISHLESTSKAHREGRGLDFTIKTLSGENFTKISDTTLLEVNDYGPLDWVLTRIQELIPFDGDMGDYLDEYRYPSPGATGLHIHINTGTEKSPSHIVNGVKYTGKKYAIKLKGEGTITSKPLKQISNIPPQSQRFI